MEVRAAIGTRAESPELPKTAMPTAHLAPMRCARRAPGICSSKSAHPKPKLTNSARIWHCKWIGRRWCRRTAQVEGAHEPTLGLAIPTELRLHSHDGNRQSHPLRVAYRDAEKEHSTDTMPSPHPGRLLRAAGTAVARRVRIAESAILKQQCLFSGASVRCAQMTVA